MTVYDSACRSYNFEIKHGFNCYYVYLNHAFFCSADTHREAEDEIESYIKEHNLDCEDF